MFGFLFGKKPQTKKGKYIDQYQEGTARGAANWLGANYTGTDKKGLAQYDWSNVGKPATVESATSQYDMGMLKDPYSKMGEVASKFESGPEKMTQTYNPYKFSNWEVPQEALNNQMRMASQDTNRQTQGDLERMREMTGTRIPGLLMKGAQTAQRNAAEQLAKMRTGLSTEKLLKDADLLTAREQAQAGEEYRGYQSRADLERANAENIYRYLAGMGDAVGKQAGIGAQTLGFEQDALQADRADKQAALEYIRALLGMDYNQANKQADLDMASRSSLMGSIGKIGGGLSKI